MAGSPQLYQPPPPVQIIGAPPISPQQPMQPVQSNLGSIEAQIAEGQRQQELAKALMSQGYIPNSGALGSIAQMFSAFSGSRLNKKAGESISEAAARQFAEKERLRQEEIAREESQWTSRFDRQAAAAREAASIAAGNKTYQVVDGGARGLLYNTPDGLKTPEEMRAYKGANQGSAIPQGGGVPQVGDGDTYTAAANMLIKSGVDPAQVDKMLGQAPGMSPIDENSQQPEVGQKYVGGVQPAPSGGPILSSAYQGQLAQQAAARESSDRADRQEQRLNKQDEREAGKDAAAAALKVETANRRVQAAADTAQMTIDTIDNLTKDAGFSQLGTIGGDIASNIPFIRNDAKNAQATLDVLGGQIALSTMSQLKSLSAAGATGFGALNRAELTLLQNAVTNLQAGNLTHDKLASNVATVKKYMTKVKDASIKMLQPVRGAAPAAEAPPPKPGDVVDGHRFIGGNPGDPASWEPLQ